MTKMSLKANNRCLLAAATALLSLAFLAGGLASYAQDFRTTTTAIDISGRAIWLSAER